ncbi:lipase [Clostridia bacterium]|nr:lipase [Clostridia bacterium]
MFDGDSITDGGRDRNDPCSLAGYTALIAERLAAEAAVYGLRFFNRGVPGDNSAMLLARLDAELKEIKPTVFSMLIGINGNAHDEHFMTAERYAATVEAILSAVSVYTNRIILLEPFLLPTDRDTRVSYADLNPKINALRKIAAQFKTDYIPLDGIFAELCIKNEPSVFSSDGIHPTERGNAVIAAEWLKRLDAGQEKAAEAKTIRRKNRRI